MERGAAELRAADRPWDAKIMEGPGVMSFEFEALLEEAVMMVLELEVKP